MVTISLSADIVLTYRGVLLLAMTLQDISLSVTDVRASFLPRQQQALFYYRHWAQILEWAFVFRPHNMWLYGIYSAPAVVTPFPIGLSRDWAKCQAVALKERSSEGQDEERVSRKEESEICWKQTLMNIAHAWAALVASWGGNTGQRRAGETHTPSALEL